MKIFNWFRNLFSKKKPEVKEVKLPTTTPLKFAEPKVGGFTVEERIQAENRIRRLRAETHRINTTTGIRYTNTAPVVKEDSPELINIAAMTVGMMTGSESAGIAAGLATGGNVLSSVIGAEIGESLSSHHNDSSNSSNSSSSRDDSCSSSNDYSSSSYDSGSSSSCDSGSSSSYDSGSSSW